ncbi:MAG: hypothetical protein CM15mV3_0150 [Caudoviricetes sp.]|nr:MAG: hypothetical protein CM15mV3_0150 [Caudoviricetes sp.]
MITRTPTKVAHSIRTMEDFVLPQTFRKELMLISLLLIAIVRKYPYILGENFYSLPVDSNYNSNINQDKFSLRILGRFYQAGNAKKWRRSHCSNCDVKQGNVEQVTLRFFYQL